jgi:hypothetical protein
MQSLGVQLDPVKFLKVAVTAFVLLGACATPEPVRGAPMPPAALAQATAVLEGTMEVVIEDSDQGSRTLYFLISGDQRVPLRFTSPPANLTTGTRVRVGGQWAEDGALIVVTFERI